MKHICGIALFFISLTTFSQLPLEERWTLQKVELNGQVYFDRAQGPIEIQQEVSVTWATPDIAFNQRMNQKPYDYFIKSQITFLQDSIFVRVGTTISNNTYGTEYQIGKFQVPKDTNLLYFHIYSPKQGTSGFNYEIQDSILILTNPGTKFKSQYKRMPAKIDNPYKEPWKGDQVPLIIDAYHGNYINWSDMLTDRKITGVIHKASQGLHPDTMYDKRKTIARQFNYVWGSYHLGTDDDPVKQADYYYEITKGDSLEMCCLDLEDVKAKGNMNLKQAEKFIERWLELTGKYPVLYCNKNVLNEIDKKYGENSIFSKCPLWYARFRSDIPDWKPKTWDTYTFWQFSSEINCEKKGDCLYNVPGCEHDIDVNVFQGSLHELRIRWPNL